MIWQSWYLYNGCLIITRLCIHFRFLKILDDVGFFLLQVKLVWLVIVSFIRSPSTNVTSVEAVLPHPEPWLDIKRCMTRPNRAARGARSRRRSPLISADTVRNTKYEYENFICLYYMLHVYETWISTYTDTYIQQ